jgi:hypothetical protein
MRFEQSVSSCKFRFSRFVGGESIEKDAKEHAPYSNAKVGKGVVIAECRCTKANQHHRKD